MEKTELIKEVAKESDVSPDEAAKIIDVFINTIKDGLAKGEKVTISGFGTFSLSRKKPFKFLNPKTRQTHDIPERIFPNFKAGRNFQQSLRK